LTDDRLGRRKAVPGSGMESPAGQTRMALQAEIRADDKAEIRSPLCRVNPIRQPGLSCRSSQAACPSEFRPEMRNSRRRADRWVMPESIQSGQRCPHCAPGLQTGQPPGTVVSRAAGWLTVTLGGSRKNPTGTRPARRQRAPSTRAGNRLPLTRGFRTGQQGLTLVQGQTEGGKGRGMGGRIEVV
jgi:hypothetical protein